MSRSASAIFTTTPACRCVAAILSMVRREPGITTNAPAVTSAITNRAVGESPHIGKGSHVLRSPSPAVTASKRDLYWTCAIAIRSTNGRCAIQSNTVAALAKHRQQFPLRYP